MHQTFPTSSKVDAELLCDDQPVKVTDSFCYLGSTLSRDVSIDKEIDARLAKANAAFGALRRRLWNEHGIRLDTKIAVYKAVVLTTLLYGSETWTVYRYHIKKLDRFHMQCLRQIANIKWQVKLTNSSLLTKCNISGIESMLIENQLRWRGHVARMNDQRLTKRASMANSSLVFEALAHR